MSGWEHFTAAELECPHCGQMQMSNDFMRKLVAVRREINIPLHVTSGFRCPEHNRNVGGATSSKHLAGRAVDIALNMSEENQVTLLELAIKHGLVGIGVAKTFIHLDDTRRRLWAY